MMIIYHCNHMITYEYFLSTKPLNSFSFLPIAYSSIIINIDIFSFSMLFAIFPHTLVFATILPCEHTITMPLIIMELSFIDSAIIPFIYASTFHIAVNPWTGELPIIGPFVCTNPIDIVIFPLAFINRSIDPFVFT